MSDTTTVPRLADREAWLAQRRPFFNASAAAVLFDEHPFLTAADVAADKLVGLEHSETPAMRYGTHREPDIATWWSDEHGVLVVEPTVQYVADGVLMATPDRLVVGTNDALECKATRKHVDEPEPYWWWQVQAQMLCGGFDRVHIAADSAMEWKEWTVEADLDAQAELLERAATFMASIRRGEAPPGTLFAYRHVAALHPTPTDETVELDSDAINLANQLHLVRTQRKTFDEREDELKAQLAEVLGDAAAGTVDGETVLTWRTVTRTSYDTTRLRREHPDLAAELATTTTYRNMRVVGR